MTDRDDPRSEHDRSRRDDVLPGEVGPERTGRVAWVAAQQRTPDHGDPTDPEVPSAKRRGAQRSQRSLFVLCAVISLLLSIALMLLYRTSLKVTSSRAGLTDLGAPHGGRNADAASALTVGSDPSGDRARPAASAATPAKSAAPATDIFRAPPF